MRLPLDLSNGGWHMPKSLNFRHVNRYSEDRTSPDLGLLLASQETACLLKELFRIRIQVAEVPMVQIQWQVS